MKKWHLYFLLTHQLAILITPPPRSRGSSRADTTQVKSSRHENALISVYYIIPNTHHATRDPNDDTITSYTAVVLNGGGCVLFIRFSWIFEIYSGAGPSRQRPLVRRGARRGGNALRRGVGEPSVSSRALFRFVHQRCTYVGRRSCQHTWKTC